MDQLQGACHFPALQHIRIWGVYGDKLKYQLFPCENISLNTPAIVRAFAYTEMVDSFLSGITTTVSAHLKEAIFKIHKMPIAVIDAIEDLTPEQQEEWRQKVSKASHKQADEFSNKVLQTSKKRYREILQAVNTLSQKDLAQVASTLVNLGSFQQRMSLEHETVGGAVDVAVISKGDGFIWIDRKHYFSSELNYHFFENYFHTLTGNEIENG